MKFLWIILTFFLGFTFASSSSVDMEFEKSDATFDCKTDTVIINTESMEPMIDLMADLVSFILLLHYVNMLSPKL